MLLRGKIIVCIFFLYLFVLLSCATTQKNSLTLFEDTKDDDDDDFDDFDDGAYCEERPKSPKEGTDESANRFEFFFCEEEHGRVFSVSKAERFKRVRF